MVVLAVFVGPVGTAWSQAKPCQQVTLVVPVGLGTGSDLVFRAFADTVNIAEGTTRINVINRVTDDAIATVAQYSRGGCTLLGMTQDIVASFMMRERDVDWLAFKPVAMLSRTPLALMAGSSFKAPDLKSAVDELKIKPKSINIAYSTDLLDLMMVWDFMQRAGILMHTVRFNSGHGRLMEVMGGGMDLTFGALAFARKRRGEDLKVLAVSGSSRDPEMAEVPTLKEQGIPFSFGVDRMLLAPMITSDKAVKRQMDFFERALGALPGRFKCRLARSIERTSGKSTGIAQVDRH